MTDYRGNFIAGGSFLFTVNLAERRLRLLTEHIDSAEFVIGPSVPWTRWLGRATKRRTIKCLADDKAKRQWPGQARPRRFQGVVSTKGLPVRRRPGPDGPAA
jgi:hypothetical protein